MLGDISTVINAMAETSEFKNGWDKLEVTIGPKQIITLNWPAWKLKVCSFKIPDTQLSQEAITQMALELEALDTLYEHGDTFVWKTGKNANEFDWDKKQRAKVVDVVDAFLEGVWSPPWKCGHCVARSVGKYVPRF